MIFCLKIWYVIEFWENCVLIRDCVIKSNWSLCWKIRDSFGNNCAMIVFERRSKEQSLQLSSCGIL